MKLSRLDTIIARSSAPGRSRSALIRLSGEVANQCLAGLSGEYIARERRAFSTRLAIAPQGGAVAPGQSRLWLAVDVLTFSAPASFTGEDVVEVVVPGNPLLVERVIDAALAWGQATENGIRRAQPGEFSARAYFNGKLTLAEAEGLAGVISARSGAQLACAHALLGGQTGQHYRAWANELATLLALVEAGIDFSDQEDVVAIAPEQLGLRVRALIAAMQAWVGSPAQGAVDARPLVAIVGRPNAGKSTLFNALLGRPRAVVSPVAGTTRDVLIEPLPQEHGAIEAMSGAVRGEVDLADLAGLDEHFASGLRGIGQALERAGQRAAIAAVGRADALVYCDPTGRFEEEALPPAVQERATQLGVGRMIRVRTFADLHGGSNEYWFLSVCALDGRSVDILRRTIADAVTLSEAGSAQALVLPRHRAAIGAASQALAQAAAMVGDAHAPRLHHPEEVADSLRAGLDSLGELVGDISPDEVLGRVFSTFCVGK